MIEYRIMDATCPLPSCVHGGAISLAQVEALTAAAYVETVCDLPAGSVTAGLQAISAWYGACGMLAIADGQVVGKLRFYPQAILDRVGNPCVQQEQTVRSLLGCDLAALPSQADSPVLHLCCFQVADGYKGRGIAGGLLDAAIAWARDAGWHELRANAVRQIPQLLDWCGQPGCEGFLRRGFVIAGERIGKELREGVVSQRQGFHGDDVKQQWEAFTHLSDDEAAVEYCMALNLREEQA